MSKEKKPDKAVQFLADATLIRFVSEQAKKKPNDSLVQLLNMALKLPQKQQDTIWWAVFMTIWGKAPDKGRGLTKHDVIGAVCNGSKLTKADAGRAIDSAIKEVTALVEAATDAARTIDPKKPAKKAMPKKAI